MLDSVISIENLSKSYQLGVIGTGTFRGDLQRWWAKLRGQPDPSLKVNEKDHGNSTGETIWALKDVSFDVQQGEVLGIIGRNGAGKSTLLKILSQVTTPTTGVVHIGGRIASLLEVGTGFHPELTGRENIFLNGAILGMSKAEITRKFSEIVDFSGVERFIDTPVKRYSSGMYVRLAFAVAAHLEPDILIVDEVLAVGDAEFQKKCLGKMDDVAHEGRTVLFVSHNMAAVQRLCPRTILLSQGMIVANGNTSSVTEQYLSMGMTQQGERIWSDIKQAPGNEVVRLIAVRSLNMRDEVVSEFSVREPFQLEIEFQVLQDGHPLDISFYLYNSLGNLVFVASDFSNKAWQGKSRPTGRYRSGCEIPGDLLNDGQLRILVAIATNSANPPILHAIENDALTINIKDSFDTAGARGNYLREWPGGAVRPLLKWRTTHFQN